jgi:hypothetical protein
MKYLTATSLPGSVLVGEIADEGEPVIPDFPIGDSSNRFLGTVTFNPTLHARVQDIEGLDLNATADQIAAEYPGIPRRMINDTLCAVGVVAHQLPEHRTYRIFITEADAKLMDVESDTMYELWKNRPSVKYL